MNLYDYNDHRKDTLLGTTTFKLAKLQDDATQENIESRILIDGKENGELRYDVSFYPVLTPEETQSDLPDSSQFFGWPIGRKCPDCFEQMLGLFVLSFTKQKNSTSRNPCPVTSTLWLKCILEVPSLFIKPLYGSTRTIRFGRRHMNSSVQTKHPRRLHSELLMIVIS